MSSENLQRTQIQLTPGQMQALKDRAAREGRSVADLVRQGVDALLRDHGASTTGDRWERAAGVSGRFRSSERDLARHHDLHFAAALEGR